MLTTIEIIIIIVGVILLLASIIFTGNDKRKGDSNSSFSDEEIAERKETINRMVQEALSRTLDQAVTKADDTMGEICNEKIIAIDEYSKTLFEKMQEKIALYTRNGYILGKNLFVSFESSYQPFDISLVKKTVLEMIK